MFLFCLQVAENGNICITGAYVDLNAATEENKPKQVEIHKIYSTLS